VLITIFSDTVKFGLRCSPQEMRSRKIILRAVSPNTFINYSGPAGYDRLDIRPTCVTTKIFVLTYDQISRYDPRQRQRGEHISDITCSSLLALAVFALFCRRDHANSSYQSMYSINKYRVTGKGCVSLTARSSINQALRPAWRVCGRNSGQCNALYN
jgi:hypothetical protein